MGEVKYKYNYDILCCNCDKPRYFGYTDLPDNEMCCCLDQNNIPTYDRRVEPNPTLDGWKYKMNQVIKGVLGHEYSITIIEEKKFEVYWNGKREFGRETAYDIKSHWRTEVAEAINFAIQQKINYNLSLV